MEPGPDSESMDAQLEWSALDRYFAGHATPDEAEAIRRWAAFEVSRAGELEALRRVWLAAASPRRARFDADAGWRALQPRMNEVTALASARAVATTPPRPRLLGTERPPARWRRPAALAAAALLAVGAAVVSQHGAGSSRAAAAGEPREYATGIGQRADVMLADGSRAWLGASSRLLVASDYGDGHRSLHLDGEGYFAVVPDPGHPFIVHANGVVAEALGTEFVVRRYVDDTASVVVVVEGSVAVRTDSGGSPRRGVAITAGQLAAVDDSGLITLTLDADVDRFTGWRDGRLEFHRAPLRHVARELARWYDVELVIEDSVLATVPVTGTFTNVTATTAVSIICRSLNTRCDRDGRQVRMRE